MIAGTLAHSEFREGSRYAHTPPQWPSWTHAHQHFMFVCRNAHHALSLLADLKRTQDISVDAFLTKLLCFMRDGQALSEPQQSTTSGSSSNSPEISLSDLILQVGVKVANSFCQMTGVTPSTAAASTTRAGYSHTLLQEL